MANNVASRPQVTKDKTSEILEQLQGYWLKDVWDLTDDYFEPFGGGGSWSLNTKRIDFTHFPLEIRPELKYFFCIQLINESLTLKTLTTYSNSFHHLGAFLDKNYPKIGSIIETPYEKVSIQYKTYLISLQIKTAHYIALFNSVYQFLFDFYDTRDEFEKDIWDVRKIPNVRYTKNVSEYFLRFDRIHPVYRKMVKVYFKFAITSLGHGTLKTNLIEIRYFVDFLRKNYPHWNNLIDLQRSHVEEYLLYYNHHFGHLSIIKPRYLYAVRNFIEYLHRTERPEAPRTPIYRLFFK